MDTTASETGTEGRRDAKLYSTCGCFISDERRFKDVEKFACESSSCRSIKLLREGPSAASCAIPGGRHGLETSTCLRDSPGHVQLHPIFRRVRSRELTHWGQRAPISPLASRGRGHLSSKSGLSGKIAHPSIM
jgi:hypothetical protein